MAKLREERAIESESNQLKTLRQSSLPLRVQPGAIRAFAQERQDDKMRR